MSPKFRGLIRLIWGGFGTGITMVMLVGTASADDRDYGTTIVTPSQLEQHKSHDSVWVLINGSVYDLTNYIPHHPGGSRIIERYAGRDASNVFNKFHQSRQLVSEASVKLVGEFNDRIDSSQESSDHLAETVESPSIVDGIDLSTELIGHVIPVPIICSVAGTDTGTEIVRACHEQGIVSVWIGCTGKPSIPSDESGALVARGGFPASDRDPVYSSGFSISRVGKGRKFKASGQLQQTMIQHLHLTVDSGDAELREVSEAAIDLLAPLILVTVESSPDAPRDRLYELLDECCRRYAAPIMVVGLSSVELLLMASELGIRVASVPSLSILEAVVLALNERGQTDMELYLDQAITRVTGASVVRAVSIGARGVWLSDDLLEPGSADGLQHFFSRLKSEIATEVRARGQPLFPKFGQGSLVHE